MYNVLFVGAIMFLHYTTSATLALLPQTNFQLTSLHDLVFLHHVAPMSGECAGGGALASIMSQGQTRFAIVGDGYWSFNRLQSYSKISYSQYFGNSESLFNEIKKSAERLFPSLLGLLINIMRDKQMGKNLTLTAEQEITLKAHIQQGEAKITKIFAMNYFATRFFVEDKKKSEPYSWDIVMGFLRQFEHYLPEDFFDLSDDAHRQLLDGFVTFNPEDFTKQFSKLSGEEKASFTEYYGSEDLISIYSELYFTQKPKFLFELKMFPQNLIIRDTLEVVKKQPDIKKLNYFQDVGNLTNFPIEFSNFSNTRLMSSAVSNELPDHVPDLPHIKEELKTTIEFIMKQTHFLASLISDDVVLPNLHNNPLVTQPFGIVFVLENEELLEKVKYEYASKRPLKLGEDIRTIYCVNEANIPQMQAFLDSHQLGDKVTVKALSTLYPSIAKPIAAAVNSQQLMWGAASQTPSNVLMQPGGVKVNLP